MPRSKRTLRPADLRAVRERERRVERAVDNLFESVGFRSIHFSQARASQQTAGIPDRRYVDRRAGLAFWFEVKAADGDWSTEQQRFALDCASTGELYFIGGTDEAYAILTAIGLWDGRQLRATGSLVARPAAWRSLMTAALRQIEPVMHWRWRETPAHRLASFEAYRVARLERSGVAGLPRTAVVVP